MIWKEGTGRKSSLGFTRHIPALLAAQVGHPSKGSAGSGVPEIHKAEIVHFLMPFGSSVLLRQRMKQIHFWEYELAVAGDGAHAVGQGGTCGRVN